MNVIKKQRQEWKHRDWKVLTSFQAKWNDKRERQARNEIDHTKYTQTHKMMMLLMSFALFFFDSYCVEKLSLQFTLSYFWFVSRRLCRRMALWVLFFLLSTCGRRDGQLFYHKEWKISHDHRHIQMWETKRFLKWFLCCWIFFGVKQIASISRLVITLFFF